MAYELNFKKADSKFRLHPVISIQYLTKYNCDNDPFYCRFPVPGPVKYAFSGADSDSASPSYEVERVVTHQLYGRTKRPRYLIRWKGYGEAEDSWLFEEDLRHCPDVLEAYKAKQRQRETLNEAAG